MATHTTRHTTHTPIHNTHNKTHTHTHTHTCQSHTHTPPPPTHTHPNQTCENCASIATHTTFPLPGVKNMTGQGLFILPFNRTHCLNEADARFGGLNFVCAWRRILLLCVCVCVCVCDVYEVMCDVWCVCCWRVNTTYTLH